MVKKKTKIVAFIFTLILVLNNVFAVEIYDSKLTENVYKLSEDDSNFSIPFFRMSEQRMELDKTIDQVGMFFTTSSIDVNSALHGIQMLYTNDTVRVNSEMEYAIIFSAGNVVLNSNIEKTLLVYCTGTFTVSEEALVTGNLIVYAQDVVIDGTVDGNILGGATNAKINNTVNGKIKMNVTDISFGENAKIAQEIELNTTNAALTIDENIATSKIDVIETEKESFGDYIVDVLKKALTGFVVYLVILIIVKKDRIKSVLSKLEEEKVLKNGLKGYIALLILLCLGVVITLAVVELGVSAIIFSAAAMIIFTLLKNVIAGVFIVNLVDEKYKDSETKPNNILVAIATFLMLSLLESIPYIGWTISLLVFIIALGIVVTLIKKYFKSDKNEEIKQETIQVK